MHRIFGLIAGAIVFAWLVLDTARATALFDRIWELFAPFVAGAAIAFIFNVPLRAIENQLGDIRKPGLRRGIAVVLAGLRLRAAAKNRTERLVTLGADVAVRHGY